MVQAQQGGEEWLGGRWAGLDPRRRGRDPVLPLRVGSPLAFQEVEVTAPTRPRALFPEFPGLW